MKLLLALTLFASLQTVSAQEYTALEDGDSSLSAADAKITSVKPMCPRNPNGMSCMAYGSIVKIKVTLGGCLDNFGGYFSNFKVVDGKGVLSFGALNIANKGSLAAYCIQAPVKVVTVHVPFEGKVVLEKMPLEGNEQGYAKFSPGDISLSAAPATMTSAKPVCPRGAGGISCMAFGSMVKVKIALNSCVDSFGGYFSSFKVENGKGILSVGAININNERAASVRCYAPSFKSVSVYVPFEGKISVENMDYRGSIVPAL